MKSINFNINNTYLGITLIVGVALSLLFGLGNLMEVISLIVGIILIIK